MKRYYYDLHIHSCLSPCGDDSSTPDSIAGMGELNGLDIMALTDHNTCKNCPAFFRAARRHGITPVAGMELTTAEDIHVVCLFPDLESAMEFDKEVDNSRIKIKNRKDIFGNQLVMDDMDNVLNEEEYLLPNATKISLDAAPEIVNKYNGICFPAHIDRQANGIIAVLGVFPDTPYFPCAEISKSGKREQYEFLREKKIIVDSDAHYLWDINEKNEYFDFMDNLNDEDKIRQRLVCFLRGNI